MAPLSRDATDVLTVARDLKVLDEASLRMLQQLFTNRLDQELVHQLVKGRELHLAESFFKLMTAIHAPATLGYVLRFVADLAQLCTSLTEAYADDAAASRFGADPVTTFARFCEDHRQTSGIYNPALYLWASVLAKTDGTRLDQSRKFLGVAASIMGVADLSNKSLDLSVHAVCEYLRCSAHRPLFKDAGLIPHVTRLLTLALADDSPSVVQLKYEILLAARLLSFNYDCMVDLHEAKIIPIAHRALQKAMKEKVTRMATYILKNYAAAQSTYIAAHKAQSGETVGTAVYALARCNRGKGPRFFGDMIGVGVLKTVKQLQRKKYGDEDITVELNSLHDVLQANFDDLSGFAEYKGELDSGVLEWSPAHSSTKFWKEHHAKFEANQYEVLRALAQLLSSPSSSEMTLAVACHDIGELVKNHPAGRSILDVDAARGVKERLMALMSSESPDVAKSALTAVQKVLVDRF